MVRRAVGDAEGLFGRSCDSGELAAARTGVPQETGQESAKKYPALSSHLLISCWCLSLAKPSSQVGAERSQGVDCSRGQPPEQRRAEKRSGFGAGANGEQLAWCFILTLIF